MERYEPIQPAQLRNLEEVTRYVVEELRRVSVALAGAMENPLTELHAEPEKLFTGLIALADGTDWDPGSGQGVYAYYSGAWHKLG